MIPLLVIVALLLITGLLLSKRSPSHDYDAKFIPPYKAGLSRFNQGFAYGNIATGREVSTRNSLVVAPSGAGKSSTVCINSIFNLARHGASIIINDPSGRELWTKTSGGLHHLGVRPLLLDFSAPNGSEFFNPLSHCRSLVDIERCVHLLLTNVTDKSGDKFWTDSAAMIITIFCRYLIQYNPEYATLHNVARMLDVFSYKAESIIDPLIVSSHDADLIRQYKAMVASGERTLASIVSTARSAMKLFMSPGTAYVTSFNTIDISQLRQQRTAIFLGNPISQLEFLKPLSAIFFQTVFESILSEIPNEKTDNPIFIILEEASSMRFSNLSVTISQIRKFFSGILIAIQSEEALLAYGQVEAHNIKTNCYTKVYIEPPISTARELEVTFGRYTYVENEVKRTRPLLTASEIHQSDSAFLLLGNHPAIRQKLTPYYKISCYRRLASYPPAPISAAADKRELPLLPLD